MVLEDVFFQAKSENVDWITMALRTITDEHQDLRRVSICVPFVGADTGVGRIVGQVVCRQWLDLDRSLVQLWESHSIRPVVKCKTPILEGQDMRDCIRRLMPEVTRRGIIDLVG